LGKKARNAESVNALQYPPQSKRLLQVAVLAAVKAALPAGNPFLALRRDRNPVFNLCVPVQIAIINYLAFFQDPRASRGRCYCLFRLTHGGVYSLIGKEKAERKAERG
jgi:drug/metabolite transporter superfamily protein YnfA